MGIKHFAVIGHPIGHTLSPKIHKMLFDLTGTQAEYTALDIAPDELSERFADTLSKLDGFNVTIPHKTAIIPLLDEVRGRALECGSVNTVRTGEKNLGFTTDADGFLKAIENAGTPLSGRVLVLGAGGAARTIAFEAAKNGCDLTIAARNAGKGDILAADILKDCGGAQVNVCPFCEIEGEFDLLVNTTPVGMFPKTGVSPVGEDIVEKCSAVFDAVYNPAKTELLRIAEELGKKAIGGMDMLVWQAARAQEIWLDVKFDPADIDAVAAKITGGEEK